jgi:protein-tyrosine-phosphatase
MAEGLMRHISQGQINVSSAGSDPTGIHPDAINTMQMLGIDIRQQQSKSFDDVVHNTYDAVITVCDRAREVCPTFPGEGQHIHWGYPDPTVITDDILRQQAFAQTAAGLKSRIEHYMVQLAAGRTS